MTKAFAAENRPKAPFVVAVLQVELVSRPVTVSFNVDGTTDSIGMVGKSFGNVGRLFGTRSGVWVWV